MIFSVFPLLVSIHPHNLPIDTIFYHLWCEYTPRNYWARSPFGGKNDQIWSLPPKWLLLEYFPEKLSPYWTYICVCMGKRGKSTLRLTLLRGYFCSHLIFFFQKLKGVRGYILSNSISESYNWLDSPHLPIQTQIYIY